MEAAMGLEQRVLAADASGVLVGTAVRPSVTPHRVLWDALGLAFDARGTPPPNLDNAVRVLEGHRDLKGRVWFDEFTGRVMTTLGGTVHEWGDGETISTTLFLQRTIGLSQMGSTTVDQAVSAVAFAHRRNSAQEWLRSLQWDRVDRLPCFLSRAFGTAQSEYTAAVGRCFMVGMVARILRPGCKVDTMPVFEGAQGLGKSAALQALVGTNWFAEAAESVTSKDFFVVLKGKALVEIAELDTISRAEVTAVKRVLTCATDRYRAPYGKRAEDHARTCVFSGTTNRDDWNRDETGARRFWPVACKSIDLEWIRDIREQLFAEAVARLDRGEPWWDVPAEEAKREQEARREVDEWAEPIARYLKGRREVQVAAVMETGLGIPPERWTKPLQMRVASILKGMGWVKRDTWWEGRKAKVWQRPDAKDLGGGEGGKDEPF
ncbi:Phage associated DNA primase [Lysobacter dokdonensis DS-58]|uniref:Phage associated DNA primase n=2 Tax=Noviluteimonas TaxID=3382693 RepID=A0A0A2WCR2_9GAMM|nr:Phage associated DNA primase [Lysobacter dokdonensis DS-58]